MATARSRRVTRSGSQKATDVGGRRDPKPRHVNGVRPWGVVLNKDHDYEYHFWAEADTAHGLAEAQSYGWEPVIQRGKDDKDTERLQGGTTAKVGEPVRSRGLVLCRRRKDDESAEMERERKEAFSEQLAQDLGLAKGTAQQRWNCSRIMGREMADLDPAYIDEKVRVKSGEIHEANPYPALQE